MKKFLCGLLMGFLLATSGVATAAEQIKLFINGKEMRTDVAPSIVNGRILVPLRVISESLGADIYWNQDNKAVNVLSKKVPTKEEMRETIINLAKSATVKVVSKESRAQSKYGSGFNVDPTGLIITNSHVVENSREIYVAFGDGSNFEASVKYINPDKDIAVLKIDVAASDLPTLTLGDSSKVKQGEDVIIVGSPKGVVGTVTTGTVGNLSVSAQGFTTPLIQINANLNNGNSGGPVVNYFGEVIGIATGYVLNEDGSSANSMGVAVPINEAKAVLQ